MMLRIGRTLAPAAAPIHSSDIISGLACLFCGDKSTRRFEDELREACRVKYCFSLSSGKAALVLILEALHELCPERDEVLIPAYTCYSIPSAIVKAGLKVRLCDVSAVSLDFDFDLLAESLHNPRLLCVIPTHLYGVPADIARIKGMVDPPVVIVEDAAQTMGGEWKGRKLGTIGDVGLFSLGRGKALSTVEGGVILTDNPVIGQAIAKRLGTIPGYGVLDCLKLIFYAIALSVLIRPWLYWLPKSLPFLKLGETHFDPTFPIRKLSAFQAGLAKGWKSKLDGFIEVRLKNARKFAGAGISLLGVPAGPLPCLIRYPVLVPDAAAKGSVLQKSNKEGLGIAGGYPDSIDGIKELRGVFEGGRFPGAKTIAERVVSLPVHPYVGESDLERIVKLLRAEV